MVQYQITFGHGEEALTVIGQGYSLYSILQDVCAREQFNVNEITNLQKIY